MKEASVDASHESLSPRFRRDAALKDVQLTKEVPNILRLLILLASLPFHSHSFLAASFARSPHRFPTRLRDSDCPRHAKVCACLSDALSLLHLLLLFLMNYSKRFVSSHFSNTLT